MTALDRWAEKVRQAALYRRRVARRRGVNLSGADLVARGFEPARLVADGRVAADGGCPVCGGPVALRLVRLCAADPAEPPTYPSGATWTTAPCPTCRGVA